MRLGVLGCLLGVEWRSLGASWGRLEGSRGLLERFGGLGQHLVNFWVSHWASWEFFGASVALSLLRLNTHTWCASLHL